MKCFAPILAAATLVLSDAAQADVTARFVESAPKDRFEVVNAGGCDLGAVTVTVDLAGSAAGLIFDTTGQGAGVEVFQPFDLVAGAELVRNLPVVTDGQTQVDLNLSQFPAGATIAFTVDVDDTLQASDLGQIRVSGGEIAGAKIRVLGAQGRFDTSGTARALLSACNA